MTTRPVPCASAGSVSGSKDDLVDRIVAHVASGRDIRQEPEPPPPIQERRRLDEERFALLFSRLRGQELEHIIVSEDEIIIRSVPALAMIAATRPPRTGFTRFCARTPDRY